MIPRYRLIGVFIAIVLLAVCGPAPAEKDPMGAASFGNLFTAKTISLDRKLPPVYNMSGKTVRVRAIAQNPEQANVAVELQSKIESLLTGSDSTVHARETSPDVAVELNVTSYSQPHVVTDGTGSSKSSYVVGGLITAFKITIPRNSSLIASNVATSEVNEPFSSGGGTLAALHLASARKMTPIEAEKIMLEEVANTVASFLVKTPETVRAKLAVGKSLNQANELAEKSLWSRYLETLSTMQAYGDPQEDCYRWYDIGVANEALAYQAQDPASAIKYLQAASTNYGKATDTKPGEKNFLYPQVRIKEALAHYSTDTAPPPPTEAEKRSAAGILTNDDVIEMVQAHMDEANIMDNIRAAPKVDFDLSVAGQVKMSKDGVSGKIITYMKQRVARNINEPVT